MSHPHHSVGESQGYGILPADWNDLSFVKKVSTVVGIALPALPQFTVDMLYTHLHRLHEWTHERVSDPIDGLADRIIDWTEDNYGGDSADRIQRIIQNIMREFRFTRRYPHADEYGFQPTTEKLSVLALETIVELALIGLAKVLTPVGRLAGCVFTWTVTDKILPVIYKVAGLARDHLVHRASQWMSGGAAPAPSL